MEFYTMNTNINTNGTQYDRVLAALQSGEELTAKQIAARFSVANPSAVIHSLRTDGFAVYGNNSTNAKGETKTKYRLGKPSRKVVAAGYQMLSALGINPFVRA